jgi:hypothetical protein
MNMTIKQAKALRAAMIAAASNLNDETASELPMLFDSVKYDGETILAGTRINWNGIVKRAIIDIIDLEENNPDNAPTLWEDLKNNN